MTKTTKFNKSHLIIIAFVLVLGVLTIIFTHSYPAVFVGMGMISQKNWNDAHRIALKLDPNSSNDQVSKQLIKTKEEQQLISSLRINYASPNIDSEYKFYTTDNKSKFDELLRNYFNHDSDQFKEFVIKPEVYDALLHMKYNYDNISHSAAYSKAKDLLSKINDGASFDDLAKSESDDKVSGQLGGDLGFVAQGQILPELEQVVMKAQVGQVKNDVVVSRLGYHLVYPVEIAEKDGRKLWHVKQILIKTTGFDDWLNPMLSHFLVWRFR